jgi:hypothetical protein
MTDNTHDACVQANQDQYEQAYPVFSNGFKHGNSTQWNFVFLSSGTIPLDLTARYEPYRETLVHNSRPLDSTE